MSEGELLRVIEFDVLDVELQLGDDFRLGLVFEFELLILFEQFIMLEFVGFGQLVGFIEIGVMYLYEL